MQELILEGFAGTFRKDGYYQPGPLDSGISGCQWHRIVIDADIPSNAYLEIEVCSSESPNPIDTFVEKHTFAGEVRDRLIRIGRGRYLNLKISLHGDGQDTPKLRRITIFYPRLSYLRYLPAIYQDDPQSRDFLERFLSVFESALFHSDETISSLPSYFDPLATPDGFLDWLSSWLALDRYELLGDKNREFLLRAVEFYRLKGTPAGLARLVSFLLGRECCVKEYMNNVFRSYGREHYEASEIKGEGNSLRFFHGLSRSVDTDPEHGILADMGKYQDRLHYTFDSRPDGRYSTHAVGLFIFLKPGEALQIDEDELKKIIDAFLPVFIHVIITTVETFEESYPDGSVLDFYEDAVSDRWGERLTGISGSYLDSCNFLWLETYAKSSAGLRITNDPRYRTVHNQIGRRMPV